MKQYVFTIIATIIATGSIVYGLSQESIEEVIEKENQKILEQYAEEQRDCFKNATGTSNQILRKYDSCRDRQIPKLKTISTDGDTGSGEINLGTHSTGSTVLPSKITIEQIDDAYILTPLWLKVCKKQINSTLCKDRELFDRLYQLTEERLPGKNFYPILLGITNAESSLGLAYAKDNIGGTCQGRNNLGGIKWRKTDEGKSIRDQKIPDQFGCYLYKFNSIEDYWISKVNTIRFGYPGCIDSKTPIKCLSYAYVGDRNVAEQSWINNVSIFLN